LKLYEHEAKQELKKHQIPIPNGFIASTAEQAKQAAAKLHPPFIIKAQVLVGARGKAGGIQTATSAQEAEVVAGKLLVMQIHGLPVHQVLVEEKIPVKRELYLAVTVDRLKRCYVVLTSVSGGIEIEKTAEEMSTAINKTLINSNIGLRRYHAVTIAQQLGYSGNQLLALTDLILKLYQLTIDNDAELAEINPLAEAVNGQFIALDARLTIDDNALFRHPERAKTGASPLTPQETVASEHSLAYVRLGGNIGVIGNGAGLVMATLDLLSLFGGRAADFLDLGGGASIDQINAAVKLVLSEPKVDSVLINVLGGITRCDEVAKGILQAQAESGSQKPLIVRLIGTNQQEGQRILQNAGIHVYGSMEEAASQAVEIVKKPETP
jgi:succinyl-CoA synthetase beta subunit